jgi:hypothetical protein
VLTVADRTENDLATRIANEATLYIGQLRQEQRMLTDRDIDRIASAIVGGVLKRLLEIACSGGQMRLTELPEKYGTGDPANC